MAMYDRYDPYADSTEPPVSHPTGTPFVGGIWNARPEAGGTNLDHPPSENPVSKIHTIKIWPDYFEAIVSGRKKFEIRKNDRDYRVGDVLVVQEFDPKAEQYTGEMQALMVTYLAQGVFGLPADVCVMSVARYPQDGPLAFLPK